MQFFISLSFSLTGIEVPKFVDTVTPQYKPKFDALVSNSLLYSFVIRPDDICLNACNALVFYLTVGGAKRS